MEKFSLHNNRLYLLVVSVWIVTLAGVFYLVLKPVREPSLDFYGYYGAASAIHQGKSPYALETRESIAIEKGISYIGPYTYLPTIAILLQPFVLLSPRVASILWFGINICLILLVVILLFRQSNLRGDRLKVALLLFPLVFTPILMNLYLGNVNFLILLLVILAYQQFVNRRPYASGLLLALSAWLKIWPIGLIVYFAWKREWKVVTGALIGIVTVGAFIAMLGGVGLISSFFTDQLPEILLGTYPAHDHLNQSIVGFFAKLFAPSSPYVLPIIQNQTFAEQGSRIAILLVVVITTIVCSVPIILKNKKQLSSEYMLVISALMLITGWLWDTSLTLLLPAYFLIAEELRLEHPISWSQIILPVVSIILIDLHRIIWTLANPERQALPWFLLSFPFFGLMLVWLLFVVKRIRQIKTLRAGYLLQPEELETV